MTKEDEAIKAILSRTPSGLGLDTMAPWLRSAAADKCAEGEYCEAGHIAAAAFEIERLRAENGRLKAIISVNGLRMGASHEEIDAMVEGAAS